MKKSGQIFLVLSANLFYLHPTLCLITSALSAPVVSVLLLCALAVILPMRLGEQRFRSQAFFAFFFIALWRASWISRAFRKAEFQAATYLRPSSTLWSSM